jgi:hypothetical protein
MIMHFNLSEPGAEELFDPEGVDLLDINSARAHAVNIARDLMAEEVRERGLLCRGWNLNVTDYAGAVLFVFGFDEALVRDTGCNDPCHSVAIGSAY